ncbi:MAG TPA: helix-turn-helix domain-containing protein, partial [Megamonas funiformis]|nr:helix-turn-helix domain-containing protein [Megamonas funiformis]
MLPFISGIVNNMIKENIEEKPKNVYSTKEVAQILNMSEYTVRKKIRNKEIEATKEAGELKYKITREA